MSRFFSDPAVAFFWGSVCASGFIRTIESDATWSKGDVGVPGFLEAGPDVVPIRVVSRFPQNLWEAGRLQSCENAIEGTAQPAAPAPNVAGSSTTNTTAAPIVHLKSKKKNTNIAPRLVVPPDIQQQVIGKSLFCSCCVVRIDWVCFLLLVV